MTHSKRNLDFDSKQANFRVFYASSATDSTFVVDNNDAAQSYTTISPLFPRTTVQRGEDRLIFTGLNIERDLNNGWKAKVDASLSSTKTLFTTKRGGLINATGETFPFFTYNENGILLTSPLGTTDFSDPNDYVARSYAQEVTNINDNELAFKADIEKDLGWNFLSKLKFGTRYRRRHRETLDRALADNGPYSEDRADTIEVNLATSGVATTTGASNFLNGNFTDGLFENVVFIDDLDEWFKISEEAGVDFSMADNVNSSFDVYENSFAAYTQFDLGGELFGAPVSGNVGVRFVHTEARVDGATQDFELITGDVRPNPSDGEITPFSVTNKYQNLLPSLNLRLKVSHNTYLRFAYSRTITRPQFIDFGGLQRTNASVTRAGNPNLDVAKSSNFDLGFEWYRGDASVLGITFFYKRLTDVISEVTFENYDRFGVTWDTFTTLENGGEGSFFGAEITAQQSLDFLPEPFDALSVVANFTIDKTIKYTEDGESAEFPGVSEFSFNSGLFYDNGGKFQSRLAYTFRDDYLFVRGDVFGNDQFVDQYGQLDFSLSYRIFEGVTLSGDIINVTNAKNQLYSSIGGNTGSVESSPTSYEIVGRRFVIGLRANF